MLWQRRLTSARQPIDVAPAVADGLVFTSTTAPRPGGKGCIVALDEVHRRCPVDVHERARRLARPEGRLRRRHLVDADARPTASSTRDVEPAAVGRHAGARRTAAPIAGAALYTDSLLALDAQTGALRWYDQVTPHDVRDYDFALPPVLAGEPGRRRGQGGPRDRLGPEDAPARAGRRRSASTATTPARCRAGRSTVCPGLLGGVLTPLAVADGRVFVPVVDLCMRGSATGYENFMRRRLRARPRRARRARPATGRGSGRGRSRRRTSAAPPPRTTTVFTATYDGRVFVLDAADGRTLWSAREPAGINSCPALAGDLLVVPAGAEPSTIETPTPVVDAYRLSSPGEKSSTVRP